MALLLFDASWQPSQIALCTTKKSWKKFLKKHKFQSDYEWNESVGCTHHFDEGQGSVIVVTLHDRLEEECHDALEVMGILCHESVHVFQDVCHYMSETDPSPEFEAYSIQHIFQELVSLYKRDKGKRQ